MPPADNLWLYRIRASTFYKQEGYYDGYTSSPIEYLWGNEAESYITNYDEGLHYFICKDGDLTLVLNVIKDDFTIQRIRTIKQGSLGDTLNSYCWDGQYIYLCWSPSGEVTFRVTKYTLDGTAVASDTTTASIKGMTYDGQFFWTVEWGRTDLVRKYIVKYPMNFHMVGSWTQAGFASDLRDITWDGMYLYFMGDFGLGGSVIAKVLPDNPQKIIDNCGTGFTTMEGLSWVGDDLFLIGT